MFDNFFEYFYQDIVNIFRSFVDFVVSVFNFALRIEIIRSHADEFTPWEWALTILVNILLIALILLAIYGLYRLIKRIFRFGVSPKKYDELLKKVRSLQRDLIRSNYEKDRLLAIRIAELGGDGSDLEHLNVGNDDKNIGENDQENNEEQDESLANSNTFNSPCINPMDSRFFRLTSVDNYYKTGYTAPSYDNDISLEEFCERFRNFAASQLHLYYTIDVIRYFIASMGTARIIILQGISGTGKTSLPYAFGKFVKKDTTVVSVQPSWRERTELYGYFNEFTKKYSETDFLRAIYESNYYRDPHFVILDEMNIARVEYYFAEMLSILEMPIQSEWKIDIVSAVWDNDPCLIQAGSIHIPNNVWFVGTINNDDSTFAVADKVYDRAIPIDLDSRCEAFECEETDAMFISTDHINRMFDVAKDTYQISQDSLSKIELLNAYIIKNFRLAFGNRVMKQIGDFVSCYIACGGTEIEAIDFIIAKKVFRKFESLSLGFMKDELTKLNNFLDKTFGKNALPICKEYVEFLKKNQ